MNLLRNSESLTSKGDDIQIGHLGFNPTIKVSHVSLKYPTRNFPALNKATFTIESGEFVAIIGSTGAGKSTLVDLILGVLIPDSGQILIGDLHPLEAVTQWPGAISYVPQDSFIIQGTIRQNVTMGYPIESCSDKIIWEALEMAKLADFVKTLHLGLENLVGDRGTFMSGGQRQRLGIARSLLTKPKLLILDESTSSLDLKTEYEIIKSIKELKGRMTIVMIAHRLSTIKDADKIIYLDEGIIKHIGKFEDVRLNVPQFEEQLKILER
jgi:ABC-type branched-subunit amino acid transport system ATPase component